MNKDNYDFLKGFKKDELIAFCIAKDKQINKLGKALNKAHQDLQIAEKKCEEKIADMEARHEKQKYREWKQHVDTRYLDRYLREWLNEHLHLNMEFGYDGCDSKELTGGLYIDNKKISSVQSYL